MAETQSKRLREDDVVSTTETPKRHRNTYINDQQETTTTQELLDFFTSLSSDPFLPFAPQPEPDPDSTNNNNINDDEKESVIRHLLEASDDELGIPSRADDDVSGGGGGVDDDVTGGGGGVVDLCDGLWELEDEAANYYTLLQSELFMQ